MPEFLLLVATHGAAVLLGGWVALRGVRLGMQAPVCGYEDDVEPTPGPAREGA